MAIELLFVLMLAYLLLGPKKSAELAHKAGKLVSQFNQVKSDLRVRMEEELSSLDSNKGTPPHS